MQNTRLISGGRAVPNTAAQTHVVSVPRLSADGAGALSTGTSGPELHRPPVGCQNAALLCGGATYVHVVNKNTLLQLRQNSKKHIKELFSLAPLNNLSALRIWLLPNSENFDIFYSYLVRQI